MARLTIKKMLGDSLAAFARKADGHQRRDLFPQLEAYLHGPTRPRVCALFGLRRTGKTTMIQQAIADMGAEELGRAAYLVLNDRTDVGSLRAGLDELLESGCRCVFIDEATACPDFIDTASMLSDIYAAIGMKVVLSGTDSLGIRIAADHQLYDRVDLVHTTYIPYREHARLLGLPSVDDYFRYGGTLTPGPASTGHGGTFATPKDASRYANEAICLNIQRSLANYGGGHYFHNLVGLYERDRLTDAIQRVVQDMSHRVASSVLRKVFRSDDLGAMRNNLIRARGDAADYAADLDVEAVTDDIVRRLDVRAPEPVTEDCVSEIRGYLEMLDLVVDYDQWRITPDGKMFPGPDDGHCLVAQPGLRYSQLRAVSAALVSSGALGEQPLAVKKETLQRLDDTVCGRMLEDAVLLDTIRSLPAGATACRVSLPRGEFDMAVVDEGRGETHLFEVKHSAQMIAGQARHLRDEWAVERCSFHLGRVATRTVLYNGPDAVAADGVRWRNVASYLRALPAPGEPWSLARALGMDEAEAEGASLIGERADELPGSLRCGGVGALADDDDQQAAFVARLGGTSDGRSGGATKVSASLGAVSS